MQRVFFWLHGRLKAFNIVPWRRYGSYMEQFLLSLTETSKVPLQNFSDGAAIVSEIIVYFDKVVATKCP